MIRRTNDEIKETIKAEYGSMRESGCNFLTISRTLSGKYNPKLIIQSVQEYNDERIAKARAILS